MITTGTVDGSDPERCARDSVGIVENRNAITTARYQRK
jgi:hypothetical protein